MICSFQSRFVKCCQQVIVKIVTNIVKLKLVLHICMHVYMLYLPVEFGASSSLLDITTILRFTLQYTLFLTLCSILPLLRQVYLLLLSWLYFHCCCPLFPPHFSPLCLFFQSRSHIHWVSVRCSSLPLASYSHQSPGPTSVQPCASSSAVEIYILETIYQVWILPD